MKRTGGPSPTSWTRTSTSLRSRWSQRSTGSTPTDFHRRPSAARYASSSMGRDRFRWRMPGFRPNALGDVVVRATRLDALRVVLGIPTRHGMLVAPLDQEPLFLGPPRPAHPEQDEG